MILALSGVVACDSELARRVAELDAQAAANLKEGQAFLAENAGREGVQQTESGLQYRVVRPGEGGRPSADDQVRVHYRGSLLDGTTFDSSYDRGSPAVFPVNRLIPGWTEALQLMREGAHWTLYIPSQLAYGKRSPSASIPPNSTLVFDLELLGIETSTEETR
nr:FKBP-type peptidyl-prolyl cis-trans isomerase [Motiliproteus sp. SC1-56]